MDKKETQTPLLDEIESTEETQPTEDEILEDTVEVDETPQTENEMLLGYRQFPVPEEGYTVRIYRPTVGTDSLADAAYSRRFNELIRDEKPPLTRAQMDKILHSTQIWTEEDETKMINARNRTTEIRLQLDQEKSKKKSSKKRIEEISTAYMQAQNEFLRMSTIKKSYYSSTLEDMAEESRWMVRLVNCAKKIQEDEDETPIWPSVADLLNETSAPLVRRVFFEATMFWQGIDPAIFDLLPDLDDDL